MIKPGSRVAWDHAFFVHAPESVVYLSSLPVGAAIGTVTGNANESGSWLEVKFDSSVEQSLVDGDKTAVPLKKKTKDETEAAIAAGVVVRPDPGESRVLTIDELVQVKNEES